MPLVQPTARDRETLEQVAQHSAVARVGVGPIPRPRQPAHGQEVAGASAGTGCRVTGPADRVPELNPVAGRWRHVTGRVIANEPTRTWARASTG